MAWPTLTVRRIDFPIPDDVDPIVVPGAPEESFINVAISLGLPYIEPYLIRTLRAAREQVRDPQLREALDVFVAQEGQHYRQHMRFNEVVRRAGLGAVAEVEAELEADYRRFTERRSLRFNLAYAEGFEAYTTAIARFSLEEGKVFELRPEVRDLFLWHLVEELEHRTVAFDVYREVCGGYGYRLVVGLYAQWHLNRFVDRAARRMAAADPAALRARFGGRWAAMRRLWPFFAALVRNFLPKMLYTLLPWYSPHDLPLPPVVAKLADEFAARAAAQRGRTSEL